MVGCVLSQLKPSEFYILSFEKSLGLRPRPLSKLKNVELLGLYPIHKSILSSNFYTLVKRSFACTQPDG